MKKNTLFILGAMAFAACSKIEEQPVKKNYYGVDPGNNGTPTEAYYTLLVVIVVIVILVSWGINKMKSK